MLQVNVSVLSKWRTMIVFTTARVHFGRPERRAHVLFTQRKPYFKYYKGI